MRRKGWIMSCDVGEVTENLENEQTSPFFVTSPTSQLILQPFCRITYFRAHSLLQPIRQFTYVIAHSPTLPSHNLRHSSFSNPCVDSPTSQIILQPSFRFSYVTDSSLTSPGEPRMKVTSSSFMAVTYAFH